jgi:replicative DNA helicase
LSGFLEPPQDVNAEQAVLGAMMLSVNALDAIAEIVQAEDFYKPVHQTVFETIVRLRGAGGVADARTVSAALAESGDLQRVGGVPYVHTLLEETPTAANGTYYARIVAERAASRRLVEAGMRIQQLGYRSGGLNGGGVDLGDAVDLAQQAIYDLLNGLTAGQLIIVAGRPGLGKSTVSMDFARHAAIHCKDASAIFSLEMSKIEMVMRLLSAEARVPLAALRSGQLSDTDWSRLATKMGEIGQAPIFLDDTPNMNLADIRAKARRLKQRHNLKLLIVDYLQLMSSPKNTASREQEVSELSRGLKLLAKEIECPVIGVSQLNRGPEQRQNKRPQLSDLRESGCMPASVRLQRADNGEEITLGELILSQIQPEVVAVDNRYRLVASRLTKTFPTGIKPVFRLRLQSGREVDATGNHRFLTIDGWVRLDELQPGVAVAVPRRLPAPTYVSSWDEDRLVLLAHLLGDGSIGPNGVKYATADPANKSAWRPPQ